MTREAPTFTANIALGLREGYSGKVHTLDELKDFIQELTSDGSFAATVTPATFIYRGGREDGAIIGLINYPRYPETPESIRAKAERIASLCKERYKQKRVSIIYPDKTLMLE